MVSESEDLRIFPANKLILNIFQPMKRVPAEKEKKRLRDIFEKHLIKFTRRTKPVRRYRRIRATSVDDGNFEVIPLLIQPSSSPSYMTLTLSSISPLPLYFHTYMRINRISFNLNKQGALTEEILTHIR